MNWDLPKQKFLRDDAAGVVGDCWRCCIAAVLQLPAEDVPHFVKEAKDDGGSVDADTHRWLHKRGYMLAKIGTTYESFCHVRWGADPAPMFPLIECGPTIRSKLPVDQHAVVTMEGRLVYDPHPSNAGLLACVSRYAIIKQFS